MEDMPARVQITDSGKVLIHEPTMSPAEFKREFGSRLRELVDLTEIPRVDYPTIRFSDEETRALTPDVGPLPTDDPRQNLIALWAEIAARHAIVRPSDDPDGLIATVVGIDGAWAFGQTPEDAVAKLHSVLIGWATLKLDDGDTDIPPMEGLDLVPPG